MSEMNLKHSISEVQNGYEKRLQNVNHTHLPDPGEGQYRTRSVTKTSADTCSNGISTDINEYRELNNLRWMTLCYRCVTSSKMLTWRP